MSAYTEATALRESLPDKASAVSWEIGKVYNALLDAAQKQEPDSVSLAVLSPLRGNPNGYVVDVHADNMRAMLAVVAAALKPPPHVPAIA
jgi:hypothetical protein